MIWEAGERNLAFYANDGRIAGRDHGWVQDVLRVTVEMLCRMGIDDNLEKTNAMI